MSKLSKRQAAEHMKACEMLKKDHLTLDDRYFILDHWQESANHINSMAGAFFTPTGLARDFAIEVSGRRIIDLCAGIGGLAFACQQHDCWQKRGLEFVCVEKNPAYVEVGRHILPEATWIIGDALDLPDLGRFDWAISNPPFGSVKRSAKGLKYQGRAFEYHIIEAASRIADHGTFIIPQASAPFRYSGEPGFSVHTGPEYAKFAKATGLVLEPNCGIDTSAYADDWRGVSPKVEIVLCDFTVRAAMGDQRDLLDLLPPKDLAA